MQSSIFEKICSQYNLGVLGAAPEPLSGGFMHKMYSLFTSKGKYTVKLLNPFVMARENADENYSTAEQLESVLETHHIPILPALTYDGVKRQKIDGQFFYLFDWYDGKALKGKAITDYHCVEIGKVLAEIHKIDRRDAEDVRKEICIDWDFYIDRMRTENEGLYRILYENRDLFYESQENGNQAVKELPAIHTICHNDLDSKNVLWRGKDFRIIDLECLSFTNPCLEMYESALCWSGYEECDIRFDLLRKFIRSYFNAGGIKPADWEMLYDSNYGRLEWLEYNIKRVLGIDCGADEKEIGISETRDTVAHIVYYKKAKRNIIDNLCKL